MLFYKFLLRVGHAGMGKSDEMMIYICATSYFEAQKIARKYPSVKHTKVNAVISSHLIDEEEYVKGLLVNSFSVFIPEVDYINNLENIVNIFKRLKSYKFETEDGKMLKKFVEKYEQATEEYKPKIKQKFVDWASTVVAEKENSY